MIHILPSFHRALWINQEIKTVEKLEEISAIKPQEITASLLLMMCNLHVSSVYVSMCTHHQRHRDSLDKTRF